MKQNYTAPTAEIVIFSEYNVITTSMDGFNIDADLLDF